MYVNCMPTANYLNYDFPYIGIVENIVLSSSPSLTPLRRVYNPLNSVTSNHLNR